MIAKRVDGKGRIALNKSYADSTMLMERRPDGTIILRPAVTVPSNEAWLWKNKKSLALVRSGINEARRGRRSTRPNLSAAAKLAAKIKG